MNLNGGIFSLLFLTLAAATVGCSHGSDNAGGGTRLTTTERQATMASITQLKNSSLAVQDEILALPIDELTANADLTRVFLDTTVGTAIGSSPVGAGEGDIDYLIALVMSLVAKDASQDLKNMMESLNALLSQKKSLREKIKQMQEDLEGLRDAIRREAEVIQRKQDSNSGISLIDFSTTGAIHLSGLADRLNSGGATDQSTPIVIDAQGGRLQVTSDCGANAPPTQLVITNAAADEEIGRVTATGGFALFETELPRRIPIAIRIVSTGLNYLNGLRCQIHSEYKRRDDFPTKSYSPLRVAAISAAFDDLSARTSDLQGTLATLVADQELSWGDAEALLLAQDRFNTMVSFVDPVAVGADTLAEELDKLLDSASDMNEMDMLKLQELMNKKSQLESLISNLLSAMQQASDAVVSNLKAS